MHIFLSRPVRLTIPLLVAMACLMASCSDEDRAVTPETGIKIGSQEIVFLSDRDGINQVFVMNADGSEPLKITSDFSFYDNPRWSPDGSMIVCTRLTSGVNELVLLHADGSSPSILAKSSTGQNLNPVWSPDGSRIAFESTRDGNFEIYVVNVDGSNLINLSNYSGADRLPAWHPNGAIVTYTSQDSANLTLFRHYRAYANGSDKYLPNYIRLYPGDGGGPGEWSYNGDYFFVGDKNGTYISLLAESNLTTFVSILNDYGLKDVAWSPVSGGLLFASYSEDEQNWNISLVADVTNPTATTRGVAISADDDFDPVWKPDGTQILFTTNRDGDQEIYLTDTNGQNQVNLTNNRTTDSKPDWR